MKIHTQKPKGAVAVIIVENKNHKRKRTRSIKRSDGVKPFTEQLVWRPYKGELFLTA